MQECCNRFVMFYKFTQIRRNGSPQSSQLYVTFRLKLDCPTIQDKHHLIRFRLKSEQNENRISLYFDNAMYQTNCNILNGLWFSGMGIDFIR